MKYRVLLLRAPSGVDVDVALGALPFEERSVRRSSAWTWAGSETETLLTCSGEDLVVHKVVAGRDRDWSDIERILVRQHGRLDFRRVRDEATLLLELKGDLVAFETFERLVKTVDRRLNEPRLF